MSARKELFDCIRLFMSDGKFTPEQVKAVDDLADKLEFPRESDPSDDPITERVALELIGHEAIVLEWYKDSKGIGTWGVGVTNASGHSVDRYKDNPQTVQTCLVVFLWLLRERYVRDVLRAFDGHDLTESQFGAALSFHYNTGAILTADWVESWKSGNAATARAEIMNWKKPAAVIERREKERDLFFSGKWSQNGTTTIWPVKKPSYAPDWSNGKKVDIRQALKSAMKEQGK